MTPPDNWQRLFEHVGRLTNEVKRVADALERNGRVNEPEAPGEAQAIWTQLRNELPYMCPTVTRMRWPRTPPVGFAKVVADYDASEILATARAYGKHCSDSDNERRWWGPGMFGEKRWQIAVELTTERPGYVTPEPMPNVLTPAVQAILAHVDQNYPAALELRETTQREFRGRTLQVTTQGPALSLLVIEQDVASVAGNEREAYALEYLLDVWNWAAGGRASDPPRIGLTGLFVVDGERRWPARVEQMAFQAIASEVDALNKQTSANTLTTPEGIK
jgi:hypothetical protein